MPDGTGLQVLPALRATCPAARIVFFSAAPEVREPSKAAGADAFVSKNQPFSDLAAALLAR